MIYLLLAYEFFKIGLFSFGGGYATVPFLYHIAQIYNWYTIEELSQMIAVASITPGPIGINMATYAGLKTTGIFGALISTTFEVLPSLMLVLIVAKLLKKYSENYYVKIVITTLKPISVALLTSVLINLLKPELNNIKSIIILILLLITTFNQKKSPIFYIVTSLILGILFNLFF